MELWELFKNIDRNHNGRLEKEELAEAFSGSGLAVSRARLDRFFAEVDSNGDGALSFEEWRYDGPVETEWPRNHGIANKMPIGTSSSSFPPPSLV